MCDGLDAEFQLPAYELDKVRVGAEAVERGEDGGGGEERGGVVGEGVVRAAEHEDRLRPPPQLAQVGLGDGGAEARQGVVQEVEGRDARQLPLQLVEDQQLPVLKLKISNGLIIHLLIIIL